MVHARYDLDHVLLKYQVFRPIGVLQRQTVLDPVGFQAKTYNYFQQNSNVFTSSGRLLNSILFLDFRLLGHRESSKLTYFTVKNIKSNIYLYVV